MEVLSRVFFLFFFQLACFLDKITDKDSMEDEFWERVKTLLRRHNQTQNQFCELHGISFATFQGWIAKRRLPDAYSCIIIAKGLGTTVEYLFSEIPFEEKDPIEEKVKFSPATKRIVMRIINLKENEIERVEKGLDGLLSALNFDNFSSGSSANVG